MNKDLGRLEIMSRIKNKFDELRSQNKKALVVYLTAGDPNLEDSVAAALAAIEAGADILEVGVPFSDPLADGPVIQRAMNRALEAGGGFDGALEVVRRVRAKSDVPIILFGYVNPLMWHGLKDSCARVADAGGDGFLVVDLPPEEADELKGLARERNLDWITLVAPTSGAERTEMLAQSASGFVYVISMTGVTGAKLSQTDTVQKIVSMVKSATDVPACVGFGVRDRASARAVAEVADGVVVGSAIVKLLEENQGIEGTKAVTKLVGELRAGIDEAV